MRRLLIAAAVSLLPLSAHAAVVDSSANGLAVKHVITVSATPEKAWKALVDVGHWWGSEHTYSGNATNMRLETKPGGCWCETLPNGGFVQHMALVFLQPNQKLVLTGGLGPLQTTGASGAMTFTIAPKGTGSEITLTYNIGGYFPGGLGQIGAGVDHVLVEQMGRLQRLIDTGSADEAKPVTQ